MLVPPAIGPTGGLTSHTATRASAAPLPAHATFIDSTDPFCGSVIDHSTAGTTGSYHAGTAQLTLQLPYAAAASSAARLAAATSGLGAGASGSLEGAGAAPAEKRAAAVAAGLGTAIGLATGLVAGLDAGPAAGLEAGPAAGLVAKLMAGLRAGLTAGPLRLTSCGGAAGTLTGDAISACTYWLSNAVDCVKLATPSCVVNEGSWSGAEVVHHARPRQENLMIPRDAAGEQHHHANRTTQIGCRCSGCGVQLPSQCAQVDRPATQRSTGQSAAGEQSWACIGYALETCRVVPAQRSARAPRPGWC